MHRERIEIRRVLAIAFAGIMQVAARTVNSTSSHQMIDNDSSRLSKPVRTADGLYEKEMRGVSEYSVNRT